MFCFIDSLALSTLAPPSPLLLLPLKKTKKTPTNHSLSPSVNKFNSYCEIFSNFQDDWKYRSLPTITFIVNFSSMCSYTQKFLTVPFPGQKMLSCFVLINLLSENVNFVSLYLVCIFRHLDFIRRNTPYLSIFGPNRRKYGPE